MCLDIVYGIYEIIVYDNSLEDVDWSLCKFGINKFLKNTNFELK